MVFQWLVANPMRPNVAGSIWETLPTASNHLGVIEKFRTNLVGGAITILKNIIESMGRMTSHI